MKNLVLFLTISILTFTSYFVSSAQTTTGPSVEIVPQNGNYLYRIGDTAVMNVNVITPGNIKNPTEVTYRLSADGDRTLEEGTLHLNKGKGRISGTLDQPGFLRCDITCTVGNDALHTACGCGFNVEEIHPAGKLPENYDRFWREAKAELLRIPIDAQLEEVAVVDPGDAQRFKVGLANVNGSRVYGWLHLPEGDGPFPTVLSIPGSGIGRTGRFAGFTKAGIAVLAIEVHGLEPQKHEIIGAAQWIRPADDEINHFVELQKGILAGYHSFGREDPYRYFHRRSLQSAIRALDYLYTRTDVDTSQIIAFGGSQGGGLSLLLGAIDKRVNVVVATVPGFCNNASRFSGRPGEPDDILMHQVNRTMSYYDAALAAELIEVPTMIGVGFIDNTCLPTNVYSAYNNLKGVKKIENFYTFGHGAPPDWRDKTIQWILGNKESSHIEHPHQTTKPWAYWWWMGNSVTKEGVTYNLKAYKDAGLGGLHIIPIYGEKGDEDNYIEYLSPQWMEMLVHTVSEATELGLGIDMTTGTGWPFGGPNISLEHSAKKFELKESDLIIKPTGQKVKRAAPGGEGLVMDHFSEEALNNYFERFQ
ncbi:MAG: acetylxylan esterase, partial [Bacteroidales bacterium]|nr:acetylxylan esterase [Bacteroidales bacterium]